MEQIQFKVGDKFTITGCIAIPSDRSYIGDIFEVLTFDSPCIIAKHIYDKYNWDLNKKRIIFLTNEWKIKKISDEFFNTLTGNNAEKDVLLTLENAFKQADSIDDLFVQGFIKKYLEETKLTMDQCQLVINSSPIGRTYSLKPKSKNSNEQTIRPISSFLASISSI